MTPGSPTSWSRPRRRRPSGPSRNALSARLLTSALERSCAGLASRPSASCRPRRSAAPALLARLRMQLRQRSARRPNGSRGRRLLASRPSTPRPRGSKPKALHEPKPSGAKPTQPCTRRPSNRSRGAAERPASEAERPTPLARRAERAEAERIDAERVEAHRADAEHAEAALEAGRAEAERVETERAAAAGGSRAEREPKTNTRGRGGPFRTKNETQRAETERIEAERAARGGPPSTRRTRRKPSARRREPRPRS